MSADDARTLTRRALFVGGGLVVIGTGCGKSVEGLACTDVTGLTEAEASARAAVAYVDRTTDAGKNCSTCIQYVEAKQSGTCGTCKLMKGPVHPWGNCKVYAKKA